MFHIHIVQARKLYGYVDVLINRGGEEDLIFLLHLLKSEKSTSIAFEICPIYSLFLLPS